MCFKEVSKELENEESEEILVAELLEKETVDQEEKEVIVYRKGLRKVLVMEFI